MGGGPLFQPACTNISYSQAEAADTSLMDRSGDNLVVFPATSKHGTPSLLTDEEYEDIEMTATKQEIIDNLDIQSSLKSFDRTMLKRKKRMDKNKVWLSYLRLEQRKGTLEEVKNKILSYSPGAWIEKVGGLRRSDFKIPKTTTLLVVGPSQSGKSSLINRIYGVFEDHKLVRAQVFHDSNVQDGTNFLQECMIPGNSSSFCLYDTRGLSDNNPADNYEMLKSWITKGVRHGELIIRDSDSPKKIESMKCKAHQIHNSSSKRRMINFVIFVVNGASVFRTLKDRTANLQYTDMLAETFSCPYLSFKDAKPIVVFTHGDLLSRFNRLRVRIHLGELLHIPPDEQVFDIPDTDDATTKLSILDMLQEALRHADRNLPCKNRNLYHSLQLSGKQAVVVRVAFVMIYFLLMYFAWRWANLMVMKATDPDKFPLECHYIYGDPIACYEFYHS